MVSPRKYGVMLVAVCAGVVVLASFAGVGKQSSTSVPELRKSAKARNCKTVSAQSNTIRPTPQNVNAFITVCATRTKSSSMKGFDDVWVDVSNWRYVDGRSGSTSAPFPVALTCQVTTSANPGGNNIGPTRCQGGAGLSTVALSDGGQSMIAKIWVSNKMYVFPAGV